MICLLRALNIRCQPTGIRRACPGAAIQCSVRRLFSTSMKVGSLCRRAHVHLTLR